MKVTYIHHSGFLVETASRYYLFDYFDGELPDMNPDKPIWVFASHGHADHYQPAVFAQLAGMGMDCHAVLGKDIPAKKYPQGVSTICAHPGKAYALDGTVICTLHSTDAGVAYIVEDPEGTIYHAGDLNDWYWEGEPDRDNRQMRGSYRHEISQLRRADLAFVVLDPRQEAHYADGMCYFLEHVACPIVYPMHYWDQPQVIDRFLEDYPQYQERIHNTEQAKGSEITCSSK